jgi:hypothetical protein
LFTITYSQCDSQLLEGDKRSTQVGWGELKDQRHMLMSHYRAPKLVDSALTSAMYMGTMWVIAPMANPATALPPNKWP